MKAAELRSAVLNAKQGSILVRAFREEIEEGWLSGYVEWIGDEFFALQLVDSGCRLDGFACVRFRDVSMIDIPHPHASFLTAALRSGRQKRLPFSLEQDGNLRALIEFAVTQFPLLSLHLEKKSPEKIYIGRVCSLDSRKLLLSPIDPNATWKKNNISIILSKVTRVDFGGAYEKALFRVASGIQALQRVD